MHISTALLAVLGICAFATALSAPPVAKPGEFFLVATEQSERSPYTSTLRGVSAITPFQEDPLSSTLVLRLLNPGYYILPAFKLTSANTLSTFLSIGHGEYNFDTAPVVSGQCLQFLRSNRITGNIGLRDGYLVSVDGETEGWAVCQTERGAEALFWKGTGGDCKKTFLQAVTGAPY